MAEIDQNWHQIGTALGVPFGKLQGMQINPGANTSRLTEVIDLWHKNKKRSATWSMVLEAVEGPIVNNQLIGQKIREWLAKEPQFTKYMENRRNKEES